MAGYPDACRPHPDAGRFQISSGRLSTHPGLLLDAPRWPSESSQGKHLLFFGSVQDVAHIDEGYMPHAEINVPGLILVGRFSSDLHWPVLGDP